MSTLSIPLSRPEDARALFGAQDVFLRQIRDALGVSILLRGDSLNLEGDEPHLGQAKEILEELLQLVRRQGFLKDEDVSRVLTRVSGEVSSQSAIDLFQRAKRVQPRTKGQEEYVEAIRRHDLIFCTGPAGCGKTYLAVAMAVNALRKETVRKIVLVRPAVEAGERLGFLPGDMLAKVNPFLRPLLDAMQEMLDFEQVKRYIEADIVEILPLAFMRGRTLNETFIILDEAQNTTSTQMMMFLTRMGEGAKIVVTGDPTQTDLPPNTPSGLDDAVRRLSGIEGVAAVELTGRDIVRHRLVREIVKAYDDQDHRKAKRR
ncbi:MAG: PhoH family protein [Planctomyces sp.]|nr:PhoH family protein [Planctomyces sp.]